MLGSFGIFSDFEIQLFNQNIKITTIENFYNTFLENKVPIHPNGDLAEKIGDKKNFLFLTQIVI